MTPTEVDPLIEDFAQLIEQFGDEAVKELALAVYGTDLAKAVPDSEPDDITALEERVGVLEEIVSKLADQAGLNAQAGLAKSTGKLSEQDRKAVAEMARGF